MVCPITFRTYDKRITLDTAWLETTMTLTDTVEVVKNTMVMIVHGLYDINLNGEYENIREYDDASAFFVKGDVTVNLLSTEPA